jgi:DNA-binding LytR/AlgR family response regulator
MTARVLARLREPIGEAWRRPLSAVEMLYVGCVLFVVGTAYCQLYCALAMPAMDGMHMRLTLSMWRSAIETVPALIAFELSKRVLSRATDAAAMVGVVAVLLLAAVISTVMVYVCHGFFFTSEMPLRPVIADRLPGITLTAIAIAWASRQARTATALAVVSRSPEQLPPADWIDWVRAAGNYVEIRVAGRTRLLRMTLRQARALLPREQFIQIHRSVIVNRARIATVKGRRSVEMADGTSFTVGDAHRSNLPEL